MNNERLEYIDFVKGIAIIAVTIGHVVGSYSFGYSWLSFYVYSFELPAFFLVSGWLGQKSNKEYRFKDYIKKQLTSIVYPYVTFSLIYTVVYTLVSIRKGLIECIRTVASSCFYTISLYGLGALWFMPTFFIASIAAYAIWKACRKKIYILVVLTAVIVVIGCILSGITENLSFWNDKEAMGYSIVRRFIWWNLSLLSRSIICASLVLLGRLLYILKHALRMRGGIGNILVPVVLLISGFVLAIQQKSVVDLHFSFIYNPVLFYMSSISTTAGLMLLGTKISVKWINYLGRNSLIVMAGQLIQAYMCRAVNELVLEPLGNEAKACAMASLFTVIFVLICSSIAAWAIYKNKYLNLLITPPRRRREPGWKGRA